MLYEVITAHGECNALLLEHVIRYNFDSVPDRYRDISRALKGAEPSDNPSRCCDELIDEIIRLKQSVHILNGLAQRGVNETHIHRLASFAYQDACIYTNPKKPEVENIEQVFRAAL